MNEFKRRERILDDKTAADAPSTERSLSERPLNERTTEANDPVAIPVPIRQPESRMPENTMPENRTLITPPPQPQPTTAAAARTAAAATAAHEEEKTALFAPNEANELRSRWDSVQVGFVDEPRKTVKEADELVALTMKRLGEVFAEERRKLEQQWDRGDDVSTEDLRLALRRYRSFFSRLLTF